MNLKQALRGPSGTLKSLCILILIGNVGAAYGVDDLTQNSFIAPKGNPLTPAEDPLPLNFYDDFSTPAGYLVYRSQDEGVSLVDMEAGPLTIRTASDDDKDDRSQADLTVWGKSDSISVGLSLSSETNMPNTAGLGAEAKIQVGGSFYNDIADGGVDGDRNNNLGDVWVSGSIQIRDDGGKRIQFCIDRDSGDGDSEPLNVFNDGTDNCTRFGNFVPALDTVYQLSIALNRETKTLTLGLDDLTEIVNVETPVFIAARDEKKISVRNRGDAGYTVGRIHNVSNDLATWDFETETVAIAPYENYWDTQQIGNEIEFSDGKAKLKATSTAGNRESVKIRTEGGHDYIEATMNVSSDSVVGDSDAAMIIARVAGSFYNDTQHGGSGNEAEFGDKDATGDVWASLELSFYPNGSSDAKVCAWRSNDAGFDDATSLINRADELSCDLLSIQPQLDTDYKMSIEVDKVNGELIYTVEEEQYKYTSLTPVFDPANHWKRPEFRAEEDSVVIGTIDELRTSKTAVSLLESGNGIGRKVPVDLNSDTDDSGSSGGGCTMVNGSNDSMMLIILLLATFGFFVKRNRH